MSDNVNIIRRMPIGERPDAERFAEQFSKLGTAIGSGIAGNLQAKKQAKLIQQENMALKKKFGFDFEGINDPKTRQKIQTELLKGKIEEQQSNRLMQAAGLGGQKDYTNNQMQPAQEQNLRDEFAQNVLPELERTQGHLSPQQQSNAFESFKNDTQQQQEQQQAQPREDTAEDLYRKAGATALIKNGAPVSRVLTAQATALLKKQDADRKFYSQRSNKYLEKADEDREVLNKKTQAVNLLEDAVQNMSGGLTLDYLADVTGNPLLRSAKGAQFKSATKEFLLGNISRVGARPNQWIEQQIAQMMPNIGNSKEANETLIAASRADLKVEQRRLELVGELEDKYLKDLGYVPDTLAREVNALVKPYAEEVQKRLGYDLRVIQERESSPIELSKLTNVPKGTPLTLNKFKAMFPRVKGSTNKEKEENLIKMAEKAGYQIMSDEFYETVK